MGLPQIMETRGEEFPYFQKDNGYFHETYCFYSSHEEEGSYVLKSVVSVKEDKAKQH